MPRVPTITAVVPYFGKWPPWFPAFLTSCAANPSIRWFFFTDCSPIRNRPENVTQISFTLEDLNRLATKKLGIDVNKGVYSQVDLKPTYGLLFDEYLAGSEFWANADIDVIWGDLRHFFDDQLLNSFEILSSRHSMHISGHFTLWRNTEKINTIYRRHPDWQSWLSNPRHTCFDENGMSPMLRRESDVSILWTRRLVVDYFDLEAHPYGWFWKDGHLFDGENKEVCYLHFMTWKRYMKAIDFPIGEYPTQFAVSRRGIWSKEIPFKEKVLNAGQYDTFFTAGIHLKRQTEARIRRLVSHRAKSTAIQYRIDEKELVPNGGVSLGSSTSIRRSNIASERGG